MTLPYDTPRCRGHDNPVCEGCRRLEPGDPMWQCYFKVPNPVGTVALQCPGCKLIERIR